MNFQTNSCYREKEKNLIVETLLAGGHSLLLVGKAGLGTSTLLKFAAEELETKGANLVRIAPDSKKQILVNMAYQLLLYAEVDKLPTSPRLQKEVTSALQNRKSQFNPLQISTNLETKTVRFQSASLEDLRRLAKYFADGRLVVKIITNL